MGDVISMDGAKLSSAEVLAMSEFMDEIFEVCDHSGLEAETVCFLMINTFSKSAFKHLCPDHSWELIMDAVHSANKAVKND